MKINLPIKLHNKFTIEVKDITTSEVIQRGYAENIVLDKFFNLGTAIHHSTTMIAYGTGTGALNASRTTLFNKISAKGVETVALDLQQIPNPSSHTMKIVIQPSEHIGSTFTELGIEKLSNLVTHALIKDSEGNPLALGPKTSLQEVTIYATVYFQPNFETGITLSSLTVGDLNNSGNGLLAVCLMHPSSSDGMFSDYGTCITINNSKFDNRFLPFSKPVNGVMNTQFTLVASEQNIKIKNIGTVEYVTLDSSSRRNARSINIDLEGLAQNDSNIWGGYEFNNTPIGVGDGTTKVFNLTWDEAKLAKAKKIFIDGIEKTNGITWAVDEITFDDAPGNTLNITANYWVDYIPKDIDHELHIDLNIVLGEGIQE